MEYRESKRESPKTLIRKEDIRDFFSISKSSDILIKKLTDEKRYEPFKISLLTTIYINKYNESGENPYNIRHISDILKESGLKLFSEKNISDMDPSNFFTFKKETLDETFIYFSRDSKHFMTIRAIKENDTMRLFLVNSSPKIEYFIKKDDRIIQEIMKNTGVNRVIVKDLRPPIYQLGNFACFYYALKNSEELSKLSLEELNSEEKEIRNKELFNENLFRTTHMNIFIDFITSFFATIHLNKKFEKEIAVLDEKEKKEFFKEKLGPEFEKIKKFIIQDFCSGYSFLIKNLNINENRLLISLIEKMKEEEIKEREEKIKPTFSIKIKFLKELQEKLDEIRSEIKEEYYSEKPQQKLIKKPVKSKPTGRSRS